MPDNVNWRGVKANARTTDPAWDSVERVERRRQMRHQMLASLSGASSQRISARSLPSRIDTAVDEVRAADHIAAKTVDR